MKIQTLRNLVIVGLLLGGLAYASNWMYSASVEKQIQAIALNGISGYTISMDDVDYDFFSQQLDLDRIEIRRPDGLLIKAHHLTYRGSLSMLTEAVRHLSLDRLDGEFDLVVDNFSVGELAESIYQNAWIDHIHLRGENVGILNREGEFPRDASIRLASDILGANFVIVNSLLPESELHQAVVINQWTQSLESHPESIDLMVDIHDFAFVEYASDEEDTLSFGFSAMRSTASYGGYENIGSLFPVNSLSEALHLFPGESFPQGSAFDKAFSVDKLFVKMHEDREDDFAWVSLLNPIEGVDIQSQQHFADGDFHVSSSLHVPKLGSYDITIHAESPEDPSQFSLDAWHETLAVEFKGIDLSPTAHHNLSKLVHRYESPRENELTYNGTMTWGQYGELYTIVTQQDSL